MISFGVLGAFVIPVCILMAWRRASWKLCFQASMMLFSVLNFSVMTWIGPEIGRTARECSNAEELANKIAPVIMGQFLSLALAGLIIFIFSIFPSKKNRADH
jgi:hypothetical protein